MKEFSFKTPHSAVYIARYEKEESLQLLESYRTGPEPKRFFRGKSPSYLLQQAIKLDFLEKLEVQSLLEYTSQGKPQLKDGRFISISHSGNYIGVALSDSVPVGLDVQLYSDKPEKLLDKFAASNEREKMAILRKNTLPVYLWSAKEAVYKAAGIPGLSFKRDIQVVFKNRLPAEALVIKENTKKHYNLIAGKIDDLFIVLAEETRP